MSCVRSGRRKRGSPSVSETWIPRCPRCGDTKLILAPANQCTHGVLDQVHVYCGGCQWDGRLSDEIKTLYVRL